MNLERREGQSLFLGDQNFGFADCHEDMYPSHEFSANPGCVEEEV